MNPAPPRAARWIAAGRLGAAALIGTYAFTYRALPGHPPSPFYRPGSLAIAAVLAALSIAQAASATDRWHRLSVPAVGLDTAAVICLVWLYAFDPRGYVFALAPLVVVEAALVLGFAGAFRAWCAMAAGYVLVALQADAASGDPAGPVPVVLRLTVSLLVVLAFGALVRALASERTGRRAEREGHRRRFQELVRDIDAVVWEADAVTGRLLFVSDRAETILGHPAREWLDDPEFRRTHIHWDDRARVLETYREAATGRRRREVEYRMLAADGSVVWVKDRITPIPDTRGRIRQLRGVMVDTTRGKRAEEELRGSFRLLFAHNPNPMWVHDRASLQIVAVNEAATRQYGHTEEEFLSLRVTDVCAPEEVNRLLTEMARNRGAFERFGAWRHVDRSGRTIDVRLTSHTLEFERRDAALVVAENVTEQKRAEKQLREAEARYRMLVERIPAVTYVDGVDESRSRFYVSPQVEPLLGYSLNLWRTDPDLWTKILHPEDREAVLAAVTQSNETEEPFECEYRMVAQDGRDVWVRDEAVIIREEGGRALLWQGLLVDITERKRMEEQIAFLAYHDELTRLPNRTLLGELLEVSIARAQRNGQAVAALYLDLDDFKLINDHLGHPAGDALLREVASRLRHRVRDMDVVARVGGDEFLVLLTDLDHGGARDPQHSDPAVVAAQTVAAAIHRALAEPCSIEGHDVRTSTSIGISLFPHDALDGATLVKNADTAMYWSKRRGPGLDALFAAEAARVGGGDVDRPALETG